MHGHAMGVITCASTHSSWGNARILFVPRAPPGAVETITHHQALPNNFAEGIIQDVSPSAAPKMCFGIRNSGSPFEVCSFVQGIMEDVHEDAVWHKESWKT